MKLDCIEISVSFHRTRVPSNLFIELGPNKAEFDKYSTIVEEMANSIKITKPNFEGVKC